MHEASSGIGALFAALVAWTLCGASVAEAETIALTGNIVPVAGDAIEGGTILIVDGKVTAVGKDVELPFDAKVVEFEGKTLFPGMVLAHTSGGLDVANENLPVTPFVDVYDSIDPSSLFFESALRQGLTTIGIFQGRNTVVGGMGRAIRPVGLMVEEMTVAASTGLALSTTPKSGYDAMVQAAQMREAFAELDDYIGKLAEKKYDEKLEKDGEKIDVMPEEARERGEKLIEYEDLDDKHRTLYRLTKGEVDAHVHCVRAMDVLKAIAIAEERGFLARTTFVLGPEAHKAADRIKETGRPVVLSPTLTHREYHPITGEESTTFVPAVFADKGIPFALSVNPAISCSRLVPVANHTISFMPLMQHMTGI